MNKAALRLSEGIIISRMQRVYTVDVSLNILTKLYPKAENVNYQKKKKETHDL